MAATRKAKAEVMKYGIAQKQTEYSKSAGMAHRMSKKEY